MSEPTVKDGKVRLRWYRAIGRDQLREGRVMTVQCGQRMICLTHHEGQYGALDDRCPHRDASLGEGTIKDGQLRCPWHGWAFDPLHGHSPHPDKKGLETFEVDLRDDGVYVGVPEDTER